MAVSAAYILGGEREGLNLDAIGHAPMPQWFGEEKNRFSFFWGREKRRGNDIFLSSAPFVHGLARQRSERCPRTKRD